MNVDPLSIDPLSIDPNTIPEAVAAVRAVLDPNRGPLTPQEQTRGEIAAWVLARDYVRPAIASAAGVAEPVVVGAERPAELCTTCGRSH